jgi:DNA polymerase elongation subunit (family B)
MAFTSRNPDDYIKVLKDPSFGLKLLRENQLLQKKIEKASDNNASDNNAFDNNASNASDDDGEYDSNISENEYNDLEEAYIQDDDSVDDLKIPQEDVEFQILDVDFYHSESDDGKYQFNIMLFGKTAQDKSVFINLEGYKPSFYIEIEKDWRLPKCRQIMDEVKKRVKKDLKCGLTDIEIIEAHKFHGFTNNAKYNFLKLIFNDYNALKAYARCFEYKLSLPFISRSRKIQFKMYESNLSPILRFMHVQNIDPVGWCKIPQSKMLPFKEEYRSGTTNININCKWNSIERVDKNDIHKFTILSFDIECMSEDGKFPQNRDGDKIIQIGMSYSYLGDPDCYRKIILCLGKTDQIEGATVKCFKCEEDLMLAFTDTVRRTDPDVITGYNIFGFDFDYMKNRAKKFGIYSKFSRLSRIKGFVCNYVEQKLESSAMGRNNLKYYNTPGRVNVDLMKYIQREYKLNGYSLDNVAANFIRDKIVAFEYIYYNDHRALELDKLNKNEEYHNDNNVDPDFNDIYSSDEEEKHNKKISNDFDDDIHFKQKSLITNNKKKIGYTKLKVKSTTGIKIGDYVSIYYNDGPTDNRIGYKYRVYDMEDKSVILRGKVGVGQYIKRGWDIFWCQAKDDVGPTDIFRLYRKGPKEKAIVAKYCLKDCSLCNRLITKLQILPNSIGMGNVCCVPLSFLFLRGQSVKIFSLVAKQCREENYLIPTVKKKIQPPQKDANGNIIESNEQKETRRFQNFAQFLVKGDDDEEDDEDDDKYEGATVFDPIKGVHIEPVIVDDYSSLYPSSMIMKNLSHNSIVLDPQYDNLPGYKYHEQSYNKSDGTIKVCRFAEKIDEDPMKNKATIPRILMKLLTTRKKCNAMKECEKDPFKKAVWDGLQLAYKITANSLYGQCGSPVSPISLRDLAACTTSIGRDMLELAQRFVENTMMIIINLIKKSGDTGDDSEFLEYMRKYYIDVKDSRCEMMENVKTDDGKPKLDDDNKIVKRYVYKGKEQYYQWLKVQIYELMKDYTINPKCIYGDTDSVFFKLNLVDNKTCLPKKDHEALKISIKVGIVCTAILNHTLDYPQGLAYEKVYWPFIIISKKRYVGNLYSFDPDEYYQKSMGLVTKRRDNADIVKVIVGGIIDQLLNKRSNIGAINFTKSRLMSIITGRYGIDKFIVSKTLKDKDVYADWTRQMHVVLADRMAIRDPGNKPQSNDRIPFVYIEVQKKVKLQGERVEHPQFIKENNLKIDYLFYITNQIMKPAMQFLELIAKNPGKIFESYIIREENRKSGTVPIMKYLEYKNTGSQHEITLTVGGIPSGSVFDTSLRESEVVDINISRHNRKRQCPRSKVTRMFKINEANQDN